MATPTTTAASAARITTITTSLVATAGQLYTLSVPAQAPKASAAAQSILDAPHSSPTIYNPGDPLKLFIIQLVIIISLSRGLGLVLKRLKQPAVSRLRTSRSRALVATPCRNMVAQCVR